MKRGVILGINLHDYKSTLNEGDLIVVDDGMEDFCILEKIDPRFGKLLNDEDNPYMYFVKSKINNRLINYERNEISKANIAFFDYHEYYNNGKMVLLGAISAVDINYIKGKYAVELDIPWSAFHLIKKTDVLGLDFYGTVEDVILDYDCSPDQLTQSSIKYFKINKPS